MEYEWIGRDNSVGSLDLVLEGYLFGGFFYSVYELCIIWSW